MTRLFLVWIAVCALAGCEKVGVFGPEGVEITDKCMCEPRDSSGAPQCIPQSECNASPNGRCTGGCK